MPSIPARIRSPRVWRRSMPGKRAADVRAGLLRASAGQARVEQELVRADRRGGRQLVHHLVRVAAVRRRAAAQHGVADPAEGAAAREDAHRRGEQPRDDVREDVGLRLRIQHRLGRGDRDPRGGSQRRVHPAFAGVARAQRHAGIVHAAAGDLHAAREAQRLCRLRGEGADDLRRRARSRERALRGSPLARMNSSE